MPARPKENAPDGGTPTAHRGVDRLRTCPSADPATPAVQDEDVTDETRFRRVADACPFCSSHAVLGGSTRRSKGGSMGDEGNVVLCGHAEAREKSRLNAGRPRRPIRLGFEWWERNPLRIWKRCQKA